MKKTEILCFLAILLSILLATEAGAGTGAIPSGPNIKMLKDNIRFKNTNTRIMSNDTDDPSVVAKDSEIGSLYIQGGTGVLFQKQDSGSSTNWLPLLIGPAASGTDNRLVRWDGTGVPVVQDSGVLLSDLDAMSGLTSLAVDNLLLDGNTLSSTDINGDINLTPNGTGEVILTGKTAGAVTFIGASSEIDEDPTDFFWNSITNRLSLGTDTAIGKLTLSGNGSINSMVDVYAYAANPNFHATLRMRRANGTEAAPARLQANEDIGSVEFDAHNGTVFVQSSAIEVSSVEDFSGIKGSTKMEFFVSPVGPTYKQLALTLNPDQSATFTNNVTAAAFGNTVAIDPDLAIDIVSTTQASRACPAMTEAQRDSLNPVDYSCITNSDTGEINVYNGAYWLSTTRKRTTGALTGGALTIGAPNTTFSVADGTGVVVDSHTDPNNVAEIPVGWTGHTNVAVTLIGGAFTSIGIDSSGAIIQKSNAAFSTEELRDVIEIGAIVHLGAVITDTADRKQLAFGGNHHVYDLSDAIGNINKSGNVFAPNGANLNMDKSSGTTFVMGGSYLSNKKNPNEITNIALSPVSFRYNYKDGGGGYTISASTIGVLPANYDNGTGVLGTVTANRWSVQRIYYAPTTDDVVIHYGQDTYINFSQAQAGIVSEDFDPNPLLAGTLLRGFLILRGGATDLSDTGHAVFIQTDRFGQFPVGGSGSTSVSMQVSYENSLAPQIVLDATRNGVEIRDAATPIAAPLFTVEDNAGTTEFLEVDVDGVSIEGNLNLASGTDALANLSIFLDSTKDNGITTDGLGTNLFIYNNGLKALTFSSTSITSALPFFQDNGTVGAPRYSWTGMQNGGLWRNSAADSLNMAVNGVNAMEWDDDFVSTPKIFGVGQFATGSLPAAAAGNEGFLAYDTTSASLKISDGSVWAEFGSTSGSATGNIEPCIIKDIKTTSTNGGTFTSGSMQTRQFNTLEGGCTDLGISLTTNTITIPAGKYLINAHIPAYRVNSHVAVLFEDPAGTPVIAIQGIAGRSLDSAGPMQNSVIIGVIEPSASTEYEVQHQCATTKSTDGLGFATGLGDNETYGTITITPLN